MEKLTLSIYLSIIVISPLLFGAVHTYVYTFMTLGVLAGGLILVIKNIDKDFETNEYVFKIQKNSFNFLFIAFLIFLIIQIIPLPNFLLKYISPGSLVVGQKSLSISSGGIDNEAIAGNWFSIAPYIYPVRLSLVRWFVYGLFFLGLTQLLDSKKKIELVIFVLLIMCCFESLYGLTQTYSGNNKIWWYESAGGLTGTYINRNHFAGLMEICLMLAAGYSVGITATYKIKKNKWGNRSIRSKMITFLSFEQQFNKRSFIIFLGTVIGIGLILSSSRGGIVSAAAAMLIMGLLFIFKKNHRRKGFTIFILFLIILVYVLNIGVDNTAARFKFMDGAFEIRDRYVKKTIDLFKDYSLVGVGMGNFQYAFPKYQAQEDSKGFIDHAHNDWAQFLAEGGLFGFCLLLGGVFYILYSVINLWRKRNDPFAIGLGIASIGSLSAIAIHSYSDFNLHIPANFLILFAVMAVGYNALRLRRHEDFNDYSFYIVPLKYKGGIILIVVISLIFWCGCTSIRHFMAEIYCGTVPNSTLNIDQNPSRKDINLAVSWDKYNADYWFKHALSLMKSRDEQIGIKDIKQIQDEIILDLEEAIRLNPFNAGYHIRLGWEYTYLWKENDYHQKWLPAADESMERAAFFAGVKNPSFHLDIGNYWVMRSKTINPADQKWEPAWRKAFWHYHKSLNIENEEIIRKEMSDKIRKFVWLFYPDEGFVNSAVGSGK